jgi:hypothetical protein
MDGGNVYMTLITSLRSRIEQIMENVPSPVNFRYLIKTSAERICGHSVVNFSTLPRVSRIDSRHSMEKDISIALVTLVVSLVSEAIFASYASKERTRDRLIAFAAKS